MGILDSIVEWIATQIMNLLDLVTGSILGALGCDMSTFLRYFPAAETLYEVFVAISIGFILLNFVWQLFKNYGAGVGLSAEDPVKLALRSFLFLFLALFSDEIMTLLLDVAGTPYDLIPVSSMNIALINEKADELPEQSVRFLVTRDLTLLNDIERRIQNDIALLVDENGVIGAYEL